MQRCLLTASGCVILNHIISVLFGLWNPTAFFHFELSTAIIISVMTWLETKLLSLPLWSNFILFLYVFHLDAYLSVQLVVLRAANSIIEHHLVPCWVLPCCRPHRLMFMTSFQLFWGLPFLLLPVTFSSTTNFISSSSFLCK